MLVNVSPGWLLFWQCWLCDNLSICPVFFNSCRRLSETKHHSSLFLHWSSSKFLVVMAACTPSIHVFLGHTLFLLSHGIQSIMNFGILSSGILLTWPYHCRVYILKECWFWSFWLKCVGLWRFFLLEYDAMQVGKWLSVFWRNLHLSFLRYSY